MCSSVRRWIKGLVRLILAALGIAFLIWARPTISITAHGVCFTAEHRTLYSVSTSKFMAERAQCGLHGIEVWTVSISRSSSLLSSLGWGNTEIFRATGIFEAAPTVTAIDPHAVQIGIDWVSRIDFAQDRWEDLTVLYHIGQIEHPSKNDPPLR